ncbi:hypothetical protein K7472_30935 [Streptomyces sp. PTM05]|uniref:Lipoprotein n=1 Tax=Streptantibioticus parmotrematis TaxID=2873249 RepID=A0ABS7R5B8_9ACTN|nr:hypothetical protein [Streptantibioticus parmotrematis]
MGSSTAHNSRIAIRPAALAELAAAALLLTGCGGSGHSSSGPMPSSTPSHSPSPDATSTAEQEVLAAWSGMRAEQVKAYATGDSSKTKLTSYAFDKALAKIQGELFDYRQAGVVFRGSPSSTAKVTDVDLSQTPHQAAVQECFDTTHWTPVVKATGKDASTPGQIRRYTVMGSVRTVGTKWMVVDFTVEKTQPC